MSNKNTIIIALVVLALIIGTGYKAVFGQEDPVPTIDELIQERRASLLAEQAEIDRDNLKVLSACRQQQDKAEKATQALDAINVCYNKMKREDIDIEWAMAKFTNSWTSTASTVAVPERTVGFEHLNWLHKKVCDVQVNSPLCKDRDLFNRLYVITEERIPNKNFFPIMLGITNAESSLGLNFARNNKWGFCNNYNNWWWVKWRKTDDNKSVRDQKIPQSDGCWLYKFDSVEDYWISKTNTLRYGYKGCIDSSTPVRCISFAYVGKRDVAEPSWIRNVSIFLK